MSPCYMIYGHVAAKGPGYQELSNFTLSPVSWSKHSASSLLANSTRWGGSGGIMSQDYIGSMVQMSGLTQIKSFWCWMSSHLYTQGVSFWGLCRHRTKPGDGNKEVARRALYLRNRVSHGRAKWIFVAFSGTSSSLKMRVRDCTDYKSQPFKKRTIRTNHLFILVTLPMVFCVWFLGQGSISSTVSKHPVRCSAWAQFAFLEGAKSAWGQPQEKGREPGLNRESQSGCIIIPCAPPIPSPGLMEQVKG